MPSASATTSASRSAGVTASFGDPEYIVKGVAVEMLPDLITCPHCANGQFGEMRADGRCNIKACGKPL
jgi:hypothetical protein